MSILITRFITSHTRAACSARRSLKIGQLNGFVEEAITGQKTTDGLLPGGEPPFPQAVTR